MTTPQDASIPKTCVRADVRQLVDSDIDEWKLLEPKEVLAELSREFDDKRRTEAQEKLDKAVKEHFDDLAERWKSEMDTLLVYAGLFSGVLTAFNIESYKLLRPAPMDEAVAALRQLSQQLNSFSISHPFVNSTQHVVLVDPAQRQPFLASPTVVSINTLWFSSLMFSLASASLALLVKQWLYEITSGISGNSREGAQLRQHRLDSLQTWHVPTIIKAIPLLLQIALILFLVGLVLLLWTLQDTVATVVTSFTGVLFIFLTAVTILPTFEWHCCYRSPQAYIMYTCLRPFRNGAIRLFHRGANICGRHASTKSFLGRRCWPMLQQWLGLLSRALRYRSWETQERAYLTRSDAALSLNVATAVRACDATLDPACLDNMRIALSAESNAPLVRCLWSLGMRKDIATSVRAELLKRDAPDSLAQVVLHALRQMLAVDRHKRGSSWEEDVQALLRFHNFANSPDDHLPHDDLMLRTSFLIAVEAEQVDNVYAALCYLAAAVHIDSAASCSYATVTRVLSAAEQWIEQKQPPNTAKQFKNVPQVYMSAFAIVAHCTLRLMTGKMATPHPSDNHIARQCVRVRVALDRLSRFLPNMTTLEANVTLCEELLWGLTLLLQPLTALSRVKPAVVSEEVVAALESAWIAAQPSLTPWPASVEPSDDPQNAEESIPYRLALLQRNTSSFFDTFGMVLAPQ